MNVLCCHVARFNLKTFEKKSRLFETFQNKTFFAHALDSFSSSALAHQIILLCPEDDLAFVKGEAEPWSENRLPVRVLPVEKLKSYSMEPEQSCYHPLTFETRDLFGLWSLEGLEALVPGLDATRLVFFNLESFWFLKGAHLDAFFEALDASEFLWHPGNPEDIVGGMDWKRARPWISKLRFLENQDFQSKNEIWRHVGAQHFPAQAAAVHLERSKRLKKNQNQFRQTALLLRKASGKKPSWSAEFSRRVLNETPALSLRSDFGWQAMKALQFRAGNTFPEGGPPVLTGPDSIVPLVIQVECRSREGLLLGKNDLLKAAEAWKSVSHWILRNPPEQESETWIRALRDSGIEKIYAESSVSELSPDRLEKFYRAGGAVWVAKADETTPASGELFSALLEVRDRFPGHFLIFEIRNPGQDDVFLSRFVERWQYLADGVVVRGSGARAFAHFPDFPERCSKSPHEVWLRANGSLSLCSEIQTGTLDSGEPAAWRRELSLAGNMPRCQGCPEKHRYAPRWMPSLPGYFSNPTNFRDFMEMSLLCECDAWVGQKDYDKALDILERILRTDPANRKVWARLQKLEQGGPSKFPPGLLSGFLSGLLLFGLSS